MDTFTPQSLVEAVTKLLQLNNYDVTGPVQVHGAEIDLVATPRSDPFARPIYIEVTVEYVDNDKYSKDLTKLAMVAELDPSARRLIVSSSGFSLPVQERAKVTRIITYTYNELFAAFERLEQYFALLDPATTAGAALVQLNSIYEEPLFDDALGQTNATGYLTSWRDSQDKRKPWIVVVGEYGTGKTALTRVLQYRWLHARKNDASLPIPLRIELRTFTRQFDARGLLHHFLDRNGLSHVPVDFVEHLIGTGRVVLLLDGYDEMAQYLSARERRACLEALAELAAGGAKGLLTSRPNYFTEGEELQVFETLYASLQQGQYYLTKIGKNLIEEEQRIDGLLERFLDRYERTLRDLTPKQTESLVERLLTNDPSGREAVLSILRRVFRTADEGAAISLSGKPVIISYLLDVVEQLKEPMDLGPTTALTEWQLYSLIIDQLMVRDYRTAPELAPADRRQFLQRLALVLSRREHDVILEEEFLELIGRAFRRNLQRIGGGEARNEAMQRYFADLRRSSTLTRASDAQRSGWRFSHNSLREFLVAEYLLSALEGGELPEQEIPISEAMRFFVASLTEERLVVLARRLQALWNGNTLGGQAKGQLLSLLWDGIVRLNAGKNDPRGGALTQIAGTPVILSGTHLSLLRFSSDVEPTNLSAAQCRGAFLDNVDFSGAILRNTDFSEAILEGVGFQSADLQGATFAGACLIDVDVSAADVRKADFSLVQAGDIAILVDCSSQPSRRDRLSGPEAFGYLRYNNAITPEVEPAMVWRNHPNYAIVAKILERLAEQATHQRRGLEQRGAAQANTTFASNFVRHLLRKNLVGVQKNRKDLLEVTAIGRARFREFVEAGRIAPEIIEFLEKS